MKYHDVWSCKCIFQLGLLPDWMNKVLAQIDAPVTVKPIICMDPQRRFQDCVHFLGENGPVERKEIKPLTKAVVVMDDPKKWTGWKILLEWNCEKRFFEQPRGGPHVMRD